MFLTEILRVLKPGGICGFTTWSYLSWICLLRSAIATIPGAPSFPHEQDVLLYLSNQKPWHDQPFVQETLDKAGFVDIKIEEFTAIHAFTKQQFIETFGGAVVRYLTRRIFGKETAETYLSQIPDALDKYLDKHHPNGVDLEVRSLIVIAKKKSEESRRSSASSDRTAASPSTEAKEVEKLPQETEVPHF
jgi:SAM-dependent methyltransferase